jgi:hypothetical protein
VDRRLKFADENDRPIATVTAAHGQVSIAFDPEADERDREMIESLLSAPYRTISGQSISRLGRQRLVEVMATVEVIIQPDDPRFLDAIMCDGPRLGLSVGAH